MAKVGIKELCAFSGGKSTELVHSQDLSVLDGEEIGEIRNSGMKSEELVRGQVVRWLIRAPLKN